MKQWRQLRINLENIVLSLLAVFSLILFLLTIFPFSRISQSMLASFEMGRMVQRAFSIVLFNTLSDILQRVLPGGAAKEV